MRQYGLSMHVQLAPLLRARHCGRRHATCDMTWHGRALRARTHARMHARTHARTHAPLDWLILYRRWHASDGLQRRVAAVRSKRTRTHVCAPTHGCGRCMTAAAHAHAADGSHHALRLDARRGPLVEREPDAVLLLARMEVPHLSRRHGKSHVTLRHGPRGAAEEGGPDIPVGGAWRACSGGARSCASVLCPLRSRAWP